MIIYIIIFISFPLLLSILYESYNRIYDLKYNELCDDFAFITCFYLILKLPYNISYLLICIPLFLTFMKKRVSCSIIISILSILIFFRNNNLLLLLFLVEHLLYFSSNKFKKNRKIFILVFIKIISYILMNIILYGVVNKVVYNISLFLLVFSLIYFFYKKASSILNYKEEVRKMFEEKDLRLSLFKITHEIKNPITVCKGYLDMMDLNDKDKSFKYVNIISDEIDHVLILLEDFLSINKIKIEKDILDINLLLEEVTHNFIPVLKDKNIKRNFNISKDELYINGDYNRLSQVLINMLKNSIESIEDNGFIRIYLKEYNDYIEIYIEDNGKGMNKEELEKIKTPFFTTKEKGTGLGVFLSNQIISAHNGDITYLSEVNKGTKTIIKLPKN